MLGAGFRASVEKGLKTIPQGKSHVSFVESHGKLYFATHVGYYNLVHGRETMGTPGGGYNAYPGGHFLSYDLSTGKFEELAKMSTKVTGTNHPGVLSLVQLDSALSVPKVAADESNHIVISAAIKSQSGAVMPIAIVIKGHAEQ